MRGSTPSFSKNAETNFFSASKVQQPVIINQEVQQQQSQPQPQQVQFQQSRVIQQVVYQNPSDVPQQIIKSFSQKQIVGSVVRMPAENGVVFNNFGNTQRSEVKESFIQNRVINSQVNQPQQPIMIQQLPPQLQIVQQIPLQQQTSQPQIIQQIPVQQQVPIQQIPQQQQFIQQIPPPNIFNQIPLRPALYAQPIPFQVS